MWRILARYRMILAIVLMTLALLGKATGAYAETVDPTPEPTPTVTTEPTPEPTEPTPEPTEPALPQLCQGLADPEPVGPGDPTTECVVKVDDHQFAIVQAGMGLLVLAAFAHLIGSWRGGRDG